MFIICLGKDFLAAPASDDCNIIAAKANCLDTERHAWQIFCLVENEYVTGPAKIGHVG